MSARLFSQPNMQVVVGVRRGCQLPLAHRHELM